MTRQDWLTSLAVAVVVAAMTVALTGLPKVWADGSVLMTIPDLPSTQLVIPSISAQVSATTTKAPGQVVQVQLMVQSPSGTDLKEVPVTITVLRMGMEGMGRSGPAPTQTSVSKVDAVVPVGFDGTGSALVALPLVWAQTPSTTATDQNQAMMLQIIQMTSYQMVLSSPLGGQAAPSDLQTTSVRIPSRWGTNPIRVSSRWNSPQPVPQPATSNYYVQTLLPNTSSPYYNPYSNLTAQPSYNSILPNNSQPGLPVVAQPAYPQPAYQQPTYLAALQQAAQAQQAIQQQMAQQAVQQQMAQQAVQQQMAQQAVQQQMAQQQALFVSMLSQQQPATLPVYSLAAIR